MDTLMPLTRRTLLTGFALSAGLSLSRPGFAREGAEPSDPAGTVKRIRGAALAVRDAVPRPLAAGDNVFVGDVLSTGPEARLEISMIDDGVFTLGEKTSFVIIDYTFDTGEPALRLLSGAFSATTGAITAKAGGMRVESEVATIGIRGTTFWGGMLNGINQFALLDGKAIIIENKAGRVVLDKPGFGTKVRDANTAPTAPHDWGNHMINNAAAMTSF